MPLNLSVRPLSERERHKASSGHARHRRRIQRLQSQRQGGKDPHRAVLHQETRTRLINEAIEDERLAGMTPDAIKDYLDLRIEDFLDRQPWWFGHIDRLNKPAQRQGQPEGLRRYQAERKQEQVERDARVRARLESSSATTT